MSAAALQMFEIAITLGHHIDAGSYVDDSTAVHNEQNIALRADRSIGFDA
jgi:hypothetical protein